ncbi:MAG: flagellar type III secretion system pore protein FliP [Acidimicrobiia bacterium]
MSFARSVFVGFLAAAFLFAGSGIASAQESIDPLPIGTSAVENPFNIQVEVPEPAEPAQIGITIDSEDGSLSRSVVVIILLTIGSLAPTLVVLTTSFTRFIIVLGLTRNALGLQTVPPAPVLIGLSMFLTMFVMGPVFSEVNEQAIQPFLEGELTTEEAMDIGYGPIRDFMLSQTDEDDLRLFMDMANGEQPATPEELSASTLIPAFIVSELRTAFIIGFVVFVPFLMVDLIVATVLMSLGMVMLPPVFISLPLKLLMFVLVDGWVLIIGSLVSSVTGGG